MAGENPSHTTKGITAKPDRQTRPSMATRQTLNHCFRQIRGSRRRAERPVMVGELAGNTAACAAPERGNRCTEVDRTGSRKSGVRDLRCQNAPTASTAASPLRTVPSV
jgi:hypothetical protein